MQFPDIKQLKELLKLLRTQGVLQYQSTDLNLVLTEIPPTTSRLQKIDPQLQDIEADQDPIQEIERLIDYSSRSPVEDI